jgi:hypothetical protein
MAKKQSKRKPRQTKAVVIKEKKLPVPVQVDDRFTVKKLIEAFDLMGITNKLSDERTKKLFIEFARREKLDPLKKEIHAVEMYDPVTESKILVPVTGYEVYIDRAEASGRLEYWYPMEEGNIKDGTYKAGVVIKRRDWPKEFPWWVRYSEACRKKRDGTAIANWKDRPAFMTMKCAISQGFRLCLREIVGNLPYIAEEMEGGRIYSPTESDPQYTQPRRIEDEPEAPMPEVVGEGKALEILEQLNELYIKIKDSKKFSIAERKQIVDGANLYNGDFEKLQAFYDEWNACYNERTNESKENQEHE